MPKVRTLQQRFAKGHIRQGEPTYFVSKMLNSLEMMGIRVQYEQFYGWNYHHIDDGKLGEDDLWIFWQGVYRQRTSEKITDPKHHTIRANSKKGQKHFKTGDEVQLAVWSGKPYYSPQIKICPPLKVTCYDFRVCPNGIILIQSQGNSENAYRGIFFDSAHKMVETLAENDGLSRADFFSWFKYPKPFEGQIIAWNDPKY